MKNRRALPLLFIAILSFGCAGTRGTIEAAIKTVSIEMEGNPTTGHLWVYDMSPLGVLREISSDFIPDATEGNRVGVGGKFLFTFEAIAAGEAELVFSYRRPWEENTPASRTVTYKAIVDDRLNLVLTDTN